MAISHVQEKLTSNTGGTSQTATLSAVTAGHQLVLAWLGQAGSGLPKVTKVEGGGTWEHIQEAETKTSGGEPERYVIDLWWCKAATGGSTTVTVTIEATGGVEAESSGIWLSEWSGIGSLQTASALSEQSSTTPHGPSLTPTETGELYVAMATMNEPPSASPTSPWTALTGPQVYKGNYNPSAYQVASGTGALEPKWTSVNDPWAAVGALFKPVAAVTLPLAAAVDTSAASLGLTAPPTLGLGASPASSAAHVALSASPKLPLAPATDASTASLALTVPSPVALPLAAAAATSNASLALAVPSVGQRYVLGQGVDVTVRLEVLNGVWETCGAGRALEVLPESVTYSANEWGPDKASFTLRRNPWGVSRDLLAFTPVEIEVGGVVCWEGRTGETPIKAGPEQQINVQAEGWQYHLDDDVYKRVYVHSTLSDWKDARSFPEAQLNRYQAAPQVQVEGGSIVLAFPKGSYVESGLTSVGVVLDLGEAACKTLSLTFGETTFAKGYYTFYAHASESVAGLLEGAKFWEPFDPAEPTTHTGSLTTPLRYVGLLILREGASEAETADRSLRVTAANVYAESAVKIVGTEAKEKAREITAAEGYGNGEGSFLNASVVAQDAMERATLLLSKDYSQINPGHLDVFPIPSLVMSSFQTPRQMIEAANAYNNWTAMIDMQRRLVYQERPAEPLLEFGAWSGEEIEDTSAGEGSEIYNRVIVEGTNAEGNPVSYPYLATRFAPGEPKTPAEPRWEGEFGSTFEVGGKETLGASKPTVGTAAAAASYLLLATGWVTGTTGSYILEIIWLDTTASLSFGMASKESFELVVAVPALPSPQTNPPIEVRLTSLSSSGTASAKIEKIAIQVQEPTLVDARHFQRTKTIQVSNVLTEALAQKLAKAYLESHGETPYGGSLTAKVGSVRRLLGGQRVHPSLLCRSVQELIRVSHAIDPDTGGVGRDGRIAAVEYTHAGQSATVTLNSRLQNFEALMARLAVVEEAGS